MINVGLLASVLDLQHLLIEVFKEHSVIDFLFGEYFDFSGGFFAEYFFNACIDKFGEGCTVDNEHAMHAHGVDVGDGLDVLFEG